jgi:hypothetical protein
MRMLLGALAIIAACQTQAFADAFRTPPLKTGPAVSVQGYAKQNPGCREWTNGCILCVIDDGRAQCSTPGIACVPAGITCKRMTK